MSVEIEKGGGCHTTSSGIEDIPSPLDQRRYDLRPTDSTTDLPNDDHWPGVYSDGRNFSSPLGERPIVSYGIILFTISVTQEETYGCYESKSLRDRLGRIEDHTSWEVKLDLPQKAVPKYLIYQRRDNYEYIDILRGNWNTEERFRELVRALSPEERERLLSYTFKELWDDLWIIHGSKIHTDGYERAKKKYELIRSQLHTILSNATPGSTEPPWGFPKGKKLTDGSGEKDTECALREFSEETRMDIKDVVLWDTLSFDEVYKGNNDKLYSTHYYLAEAPYQMDITHMETPGCIRNKTLSEESADALWVTYEEACLKLNPRRQGILRRINMLIENRYYELSPFAL